MNFFKNYSHSMKAVLSIAALMMIGFYAYTWCSYDNGVVDYVASRDKIAIKRMIKDEWEILVHHSNLDTYNVDFMLDNSSSSQHHKDNKLVLKVLRHAGKTVGFTAYYPKSSFWWQLLFVVVDKDYRKKGFASKLIQYDIDDMVKRGALKITIWTRLDNTNARSLYEGKFGFKDIGHHENRYMDLVWYATSRKAIAGMSK